MRVINNKKGISEMRVFTQEQMNEIQNNPAYRLIMNTPPPDMSSLRREAATFARWIAREHRKEREILAKASV
jgi:hypothetical protein